MLTVDLVNALVLDYPLDRGRIDQKNDKALVNLDMSQQMAVNDQLVYQQNTPHFQTLSIDGVNQLNFEYLGPREGRFGGSLIFDENQEQSLTLYDADPRE